MAAPQSTQRRSLPERVRNDFDRLDETQRRSLWLGLIASFIIGILIGWFLLGWGIFPVRYAGGAPHQLGQSSQADYVSAVADAYAARLDEESLALAAYRLRAFLGEGTLDEAIQNAIDYFTATPSVEAGKQYPTAVNFDSRVRIQNLETLRAALGETATEAAATVVATAVATPQPSVQDQPKSQGLGWLKWLLILLAAGILIYGGFVILRRLTQGNHDKGDNGGGDGGAPATPTAATYEVQPHTTTAGRPSSAEASATKAGLSNVYTGDYDPGRDHWRDEPDENESPAHTLAATVDPSEYTDYLFSNEGEEISEEPTAGFPVNEKDEAEFEEDSGWVTDMGMAAATASVIVDRQKPAAAPVNSPSKVQREVVATYTAHYQLGQSDYDQAFSLIDPQSQANLGDCGVGVTSPGGYREKHPEEVIALNVWLFDKADNERIGNYQRVLISEYVIDHGKEADYRHIRGVSGDPMVAQSNLEFTIEGENLLMACRVLEADYVQNGAGKGVFNNVKVEMSVMKKG